MHLFQPQSLPDIGSFDKLLYSVIGAAISAILYWALTRKKLSSETDRSYQQMALEISASLADWIKKFETGKREMLEAMQKIGELQDKLDDCVGDCEDCHALLVQAGEILTSFESALKDLAEHSPLIEDLATLRRRVARLTLKREGSPEVSVPPNQLT